MPQNRGAVRSGFREFVALAAAMMSTQAIAIDAMLPAFPAIARALHVANENHVQWIVTAYMSGLASGQLFWGLISDRFGRRPVLIGGLGLYVSASLLAGLAGTFHTLLAWRFVHGLAAASMVAAFLNSRIVERLGMRRISHMALLVYIGITAAHTAIAALGPEPLWLFVAFQSATMACFALTTSNFGAMAMEPVAAVAGIGASLQGFASTLGGALVGGLIGWRFNGTTVPLAGGSLCCGLASLVFVLLAEKGRLFRGASERKCPIPFRPPRPRSRRTCRAP